MSGLKRSYSSLNNNRFYFEIARIDDLSVCLADDDVQ